MAKSQGKAAAKKVTKKGTVVKRKAVGPAKATERTVGRKGVAAASGVVRMDTNRFYAFLQCSLKMEAKVLMEAEYALEDVAAKALWPKFEKMAARNLGKNEKWVPFHTVLGVHEKFLVEHVHHGKVPWWTDYHRWIALFIFRAHCKCNMFTEVQMPFLQDKKFWTNLAALKKGFNSGSKMHTAIRKFSKQGNKLQTGCFLIIPERLVKDDKENQILNLLLRTQRCIDLADDLWKVVHNRSMQPDEMYDKISKRMWEVRGMGETWVKMLMVVIDIAMPKLDLLGKRCEVGAGASAPLRKMLEEEGLLALKPIRQLSERQERPNNANVFTSLRSGVVSVKSREGKQLIQVTEGLAGSLDRAFEIATRLAGIVNKASRAPSQEVLLVEREKLFADAKMKVPVRNLDKQAKELRTKLAADAEEGKKAVIAKGASPSEALSKLQERINSTTGKSAKAFWKLVGKVESHARKHYKKMPIIVKQMNTTKTRLRAATLQVQLCEFRQFENYKYR
jgi:hypothetical protein